MVSTGNSAKQGSKKLPPASLIPSSIMGMNKPMSGRNQDIMRIKKSESGAAIAGGSYNIGIH